MEQANKQKEKVRLMAFYLPQYHPIPENNEWWGKGFTEWLNVAKARPLFKGHYQPYIPTDLGFYDLRVPETREAQAEMAAKYGISGFCYWHYWFGGGKRLLDRPINEVLASKKPNFPFCFTWANETWSGIWHGCPNRILMKQTYPGPKDDESHFYEVLKAFQDNRYISINGKKVFIIFKPYELPEPERFINLWRQLAQKEGLKGLYFIGILNYPWKTDIKGFDAFTTSPPLSQVVKGIRHSIAKTLTKKVINKTRKFPYIFRKIPQIFEYKDYVRHAFPQQTLNNSFYPCIAPNWDNTPRSGINGYVLQNSTPELYGSLLKKAIAMVQNRDKEFRVVFIKSWNEWAEGNFLEPSTRWELKYLEVTKSILDELK